MADELSPRSLDDMISTFKREAAIAIANSATNDDSASIELPPSTVEFKSRITSLSAQAIGPQSTVNIPNQDITASDRVIAQNDTVLSDVLNSPLVQVGATTNWNSGEPLSTAVVEHEVLITENIKEKGLKKDSTDANIDTKGNQRKSGRQDDVSKETRGMSHSRESRQAHGPHTRSSRRSSSRKKRGSSRRGSRGRRNGSDTESSYSSSEYTSDDSRYRSHSDGSVSESSLSSSSRSPHSRGYRKRRSSSRQRAEPAHVPASTFPLPPESIHGDTPVTVPLHLLRSLRENIGFLETSLASEVKTRQHADSLARREARARAAAEAATQLLRAELADAKRRLDSSEAARTKAELSIESYVSQVQQLGAQNLMLQAVTAKSPKMSPVASTAIVSGGGAGKFFSPSLEEDFVLLSDEVGELRERLRSSEDENARARQHIQYLESQLSEISHLPSIQAKPNTFPNSGISDSLDIYNPSGSSQSHEQQPLPSTSSSSSSLAAPSNVIKKLFEPSSDNMFAAATSSPARSKPTGGLTVQPLSPPHPASSGLVADGLTPKEEEMKRATQAILKINTKGMGFEELSAAFGRARTQLKLIDLELDNLRIDHNVLKNSKAQMKNVSMDSQDTSTTTVSAPVSSGSVEADNRVIQLRTSLDSCERALESTKQSAARLHADLDASNAQLAALQMQNNQFQSQLTRLQGDNNQLQSQNSQLQSQNSQLQTQNHQLQSQNNQLQSQIGQLQSQISQLSIEIASERRRVQSLEGEYTRASDIANRNADELERAVTYISNVEERLKSSEESNGRLRAQLQVRPTQASQNYIPSFNQRSGMEDPGSNVPYAVAARVPAHISSLPPPVPASAPFPSRLSISNNNSAPLSKPSSPIRPSFSNQSSTGVVSPTRPPLTHIAGDDDRAREMNKLRNRGSNVFNLGSDPVTMPPIINRRASYSFPPADSNPIAVSSSNPNVTGGMFEKPLTASPNRRRSLLHRLNHPREEDQDNENPYAHVMNRRIGGSGSAVVADKDGRLPSLPFHDSKTTSSSTSSFSPIFTNSPGRDSAVSSNAAASAETNAYSVSYAPVKQSSSNLDGNPHINFSQPIYNNTADIPPANLGNVELNNSILPQNINISERQRKLAQLVNSSSQPEQPPSVLNQQNQSIYGNMYSSVTANVDTSPYTGAPSSGVNAHTSVSSDTGNFFIGATPAQGLPEKEAELLNNNILRAKIEDELKILGPNPRTVAERKRKSDLEAERDRVEKKLAEVRRWIKMNAF